ncbi:hypothetical protein H8957_006967, partial [Semnopithecus entellus]
MAGNKGRGGCAAYTFNIEAVGFSKGEKLPYVVLKPPPLFPDADYKSVALKTEDEEYILALKQELRETMRRLPREMMSRNKCKNTGPKPKKAKDAGKGTSLTNTSDVLKKIEDWKRKVMVKNQMRKMKRKKEAKRKVKVMMMMTMMLQMRRNMTKTSKKRKMTTLIHTLKMEMILAQTVMTTWMKQPI